MNAAACLVALVLLGSGMDGEGTWEITEDLVYFGDSDHFSKPAIVAAKDVFAKIPEYKPIRDGKVKPGDASYDLLLKKVCDIFYDAVGKAAKADGYDLVVDKAGIKGKTLPPDITELVIK